MPSIPFYLWGRLGCQGLEAGMFMVGRRCWLSTWPPAVESGLSCGWPLPWDNLWGGVAAGVWLGVSWDLEGYSSYPGFEAWCHLSSLVPGSQGQMSHLGDCLKSSRASLAFSSSYFLSLQPPFPDLILYPLWCLTTYSSLFRTCPMSIFQ